MARLDSDGVTVLVPIRGTMENGITWDAARRLSPGDEGYDEALAAARARTARRERPEPSDAEIDGFIAALKRE